MEYEKGTGVSGGAQCAWLVKRVPGHLSTGFGDLSHISALASLAKKV